MCSWAQVRPSKVDFGGEKPSYQKTNHKNAGFWGHWQHALSVSQYKKLSWKVEGGGSGISSSRSGFWTRKEYRTGGFNVGWSPRMMDCIKKTSLLRHHGWLPSAHHGVTFVSMQPRCLCLRKMRLHKRKCGTRNRWRWRGGFTRETVTLFSRSQ